MTATLTLRLQLSVDDLLPLHQIHTMANQVVGITVSNTVRRSDEQLPNPSRHIYLISTRPHEKFIPSPITPPAPPPLRPQGELQLGEKLVHLAKSTNIVASNGIIHMIDGLLYPPSIMPIMPHRCDTVDSRIVTVSKLSAGAAAAQFRCTRDGQRLLYSSL